MLTYEQIIELIDKLVDTPLSEISVSQGEFSLSLKKEGTDLIKTQLMGQTAMMQMPHVNHFNQAGENPQQYAGSASPVRQEGIIANAKDTDLIEVTSPMVGTFYAAASPDSPLFVELGKEVKVGDTLCIIEAMKMMNELPCEVNGVIAEIAVKNGQTIEFGQVLFRVKAE
jgi:acetyl-CoA carboxylase biotin carboxyl carrier protein